MSDGVLPALLVDGVVWEGRHDPGVDLRQRHPPGGRGLDGHGDQRDVGVGRLLLQLRGGRGGRGEHLIVVFMQQKESLNIRSQTARVEYHLRLVRHDRDGGLQMLPPRAPRTLSPGSFATKLLYQLSSDH